MCRAALLLVVFAVAACACAEDVNLRVEAPHTQVLLNGTDIGAVPDEGANVAIRPAMTPLRYEVRDGGRSVVGEIPRTEPVWWLVAAGVAGAACGAPALAAAGFCIANPAVLGAPLVFALTGDVSALTASCVAPSWLTLPLSTSCGAVGLAPLGLAFMAENVPPKVVIQAAALSSPQAASSRGGVRY